MSDKPMIGVSACLLGDPVRYDGQSKPLALLDDPRFLAFTLRKFCPEVEIGMSIPRPPIEVIATDAGEKCVGVDDASQEFTAPLKNLVSQQPWLANLRAYIFKARSPSCGVGSTPLWRDGREVGLTDGIFAGQLQKQFQGLWVIDEAWLEQPGNLDEFFLRLK